MESRSLIGVFNNLSLVSSNPCNTSLGILDNNYTFFVDCKMLCLFDGRHSACDLHILSISDLICRAEFRIWHQDDDTYYIMFERVRLFSCTVHFGYWPNGIWCAQGFLCKLDADAFD